MTDVDFSPKDFYWIVQRVNDTMFLLEGQVMAHFHIDNPTENDRERVAAIITGVARAYHAFVREHVATEVDKVIIDMFEAHASLALRDSDILTKMAQIEQAIASVETEADSGSTPAN